MFFGIIITMYREVGGKHNIPHFSAEYQGEVVVINIEGQILEGRIPSKSLSWFSRGQKYTMKSLWQTGNY